MAAMYRPPLSGEPMERQPLLESEAHGSFLTTLSTHTRMPCGRAQVPSPAENKAGTAEAARRWKLIPMAMRRNRNHRR